MARRQVAQDLPCKQELEGELSNLLDPASRSLQQDSKNILKILCRWEDAAYSPREKLEAIHSNQRGKYSYKYFSFFVCRNPVVGISLTCHLYDHYWLQVSKLSSIYRYNLKRSIKVSSTSCLFKIFVEEEHFCAKLPRADLNQEYQMNRRRLSLSIFNS